MIAQFLTAGRLVRPTSTMPRECGESRAVRVGVRCTQVALAVALIPALAVVLVVGGVGAVFVGLAKLATNPSESMRRAPEKGLDRGARGGPQGPSGG